MNYRITYFQFAEDALPLCYSGTLQKNETMGQVVEKFKLICDPAKILKVDFVSDSFDYPEYKEEIKKPEYISIGWQGRIKGGEWIDIEAETVHLYQEDLLWEVREIFTKVKTYEKF